MTIPEPVPYSYFDVHEYLAERKRRAQEILRQRSKDVEVDTTSMSNNSSATQKKAYSYAVDEKEKEDKVAAAPMAEGLGTPSYNDLYENSDVNPIATDSGNKNDDDDFDLQSELESKFDKLFGSSSGSSNSDF